jgi:hypothetical protein
MRATAVVLVLLLLAVIPVSGSQARDDGVDDDPSLPPVQWNASVGIGYISTAPLVTGGLVIVKGGGDPMTGLGAGMVAYRADTGEQVWRANHTESTTGFEVAPLHLLQKSTDEIDCGSDQDLIITGWTSGILTAHSLANGSEVWRLDTPAPSWGITGGGVDLFGIIHWPTETGLVNVCAINGTRLSEYQNPDIRTYRAGLGMWWGDDVENGWQTGWLLGTEQGHLLQFSQNGSLLADLDLVTAANLTGNWRIRSIPDHTLTGLGLTAHLHGDGESRYVLFDWNISDPSDLRLNSSITLDAGTATRTPGYPLLRHVGTIGGIGFYWPINGTMQAIETYDATNVVGEIGYLFWDQKAGICIPQNMAEGYWLIAIDEDHILEWMPDVPAYTTAGCGSDNVVHAVANDASWLEVRYATADWYDVKHSADETLGIEPIIDEMPERFEEDGTSKPTAESQADGQAVAWIPIWGAVLVFLVGLMAQNKDLRRQIFAVAAIMLVLGLIFAASVLNQALVDSPEPDSSGRVRASDLQNWQQEEGMVYVAFHYPEGYAPVGCDEQLRIINAQGWSIQKSFHPISDTEGSHCVDLYPIAIDEASTVEEITADALYIESLDFLIEQQAMGPFLRDVGAAIGGTDERWWTYDLNGGYGTVGMADQVVVPGDHIDWHFDAGEF